MLRTIFAAGLIWLAPVAARAAAPAAPTGFSGSPVSQSSIRWLWTDASNNEDGFRVMSGTVNISGDLAANTTTWLQTGLSAGTLYGPYFAQVFKLTNPGAGTRNSNTASTSTLPAPPAAPSGFAGTALSPSSIRWTWTDNASTETGFRVMSGTTSLSGTLAANTTSWLQTGLSTNTTYGPYAVQAVNAGGSSASATATRATLTLVPAASVTSVSSTTVSLSWMGTGTTYELRRDGAAVTTTAATAFVDSGLAPSSGHSYAARAFNADGVATAFSAAASTTTNPADAPVPRLGVISQSTATGGAAAFTLTLTGADFTASSVVRWNGATRATTFVSTGVLTAAIPASDLAAAGLSTVTVFTPGPGGGVSSGRPFRVYSAGDPCAAPVNAIQAENCRPGDASSVWDVGNPDGALEGFASEFSVNKGDALPFKIRSTTVTAYAIEIYRLGWYGGAGARRVAALYPGGLQAQPACAFDSATSLVDCAGWSLSATWNVPSTAVSGVYVARLQRLDAAGANQVFFVVRDDASAADVLFQTSDTTWQAYNAWGGSDFYTGPAPAGRAYKISYNRPFLPRIGLFFQEIPLIRWLESNAYDVTYHAGADSDRYPTHLLAHKAFLSVGHDEYWSGAQRSAVEAARDAGVSLLFLSGNEAFWKTRWEGSYRTLVSYKYSPFLEPQFPPTWTGQWRDSRGGKNGGDAGKPESLLTGQSYVVDPNRNDALTVSQLDGRSRLWRNTAAAALAPGGSLSIPELIGYEWDEAPDGTFRPAGLASLSSSTIFVDAKFQLDGSYAPGWATHNLGLYRAQSGALVFGAGTMQWSWGLDSAHNGGTPAAPSAIIRQATVNMLADAGVQPGALQAGLVPATPSTDVLPPVSSVLASTDAVYAAGTLATVTGTAADAGGGVVAGVEVSTDGGRLWHAATFKESWLYRWTPTTTGRADIRSRAVDDSGRVEPDGPRDFRGVAVGTGTIAWTWRDLSSVESGYRVKAGTAGVSGSLAADTVLWLQTGLTPNTTYGPYVAEAFTVAGGTPSLSASATTPAAQPLLTSLSVTSTSVLASWSSGGNPAGTVYELRRDGSVIATTTALSFLDTGFAPGTGATYDVRALGWTGATSFSAAVSTTTAPPDPPAAPSGFAGAAQSERSILWTWADASDNEQGFRVMSGGVNVSGDLPAGATSWLQTGLSTNTVYGPYVVETFNAGGAAQSAPASRATLTSVPSLSIASVSSTTVSLTWSGDGTTYVLRRDGAAIATTTASAFTDFGLAALSAHAYDLLALNVESAATAFSAPASTKTAAPDAPGAASGFAGAAQSTGSILWTWTGAAGEDGYRVMAGRVSLSGDLPAGATSWLQTGLSSNTLYGPYFARAFNAGGSADSGAASRYTLAASPAGLVVTAVSSSTVGLAWDAAGNPGGTVFEVLRGTIALPTTELTTLTDAGLAALTSYTYSVRARSEELVWSAFSASVSTTTAPPDAPEAPGAFAGAAASASSILWTWTDPPAAGFRVVSGTTSLSGDLPPGTTAWLQTGLSTNTLYGPFQVESFNAGGSTRSNAASRFTLAAPPLAPSVVSVTSVTATLAWALDGNPPGTAFVLRRGGVAVATTTALGAADGPLAPGTTYLYDLLALVGDGSAAGPSPAVAAVTRWPGPPSLRAGIATPADGQRFGGNRVSVLAQIVIGDVCATEKVLFQYKPSSAAAWADMLAASAGNPNPDLVYPYYVHWDVSGFTPGQYDLRAVAYDCNHVPDWGPPVTTAWIDPALPQLLELDLGGGRSVKTQEVYNALSNVVTMGAQDAAQVAAVRLPPGSLTASTATLKLVSNSPLSLVPANAVAGVSVLVSFEGAGTLTAGRGFELSLEYPDANEDGVVDGRHGLRASLLEIWRYDDASGKWLRPFTSSVDLSRHTVSGTAFQPGLYALFAPLAAPDLRDARVYPYPFRPNSGNPDLGRAFSAGDPNSGVIFDNLTNPARVKVYTTAGQLVTEFSVESPLGRAQWDARNRQGNPVASGAYVAVISAPGHKPVTRKILIIR